MNKEEALKILSIPREEFNVGDHVYYADYEPEVIEVIIVAKTKSHIGFNTCYSLQNKKLNKLIHTPFCHIFKTIEEASKCLEAIKLIKKEDKTC